MQYLGEGLKYLIVVCGFFFLTLYRLRLSMCPVLLYFTLNFHRKKSVDTKNL